MNERIEWAIFGQSSHHPMIDKRFTSRDEAEAWIVSRYLGASDLEARFRKVSEWSK